MTDIELELMLYGFLEKAQSLENRVSQNYEIVAVVSESVAYYLRKYSMITLGYTDTMRPTLFGYPVVRIGCKVLPDGKFDSLEPAVRYNSPDRFPDGIITGDYVIKDGGLMHTYNVLQGSGGYNVYFLTSITETKDVLGILVEDCVPVDDFGKNIDTSAIADYLSSIVVK